MTFSCEREVTLRNLHTICSCSEHLPPHALVPRNNCAALDEIHAAGCLVLVMALAFFFKFARCVCASICACKHVRMCLCVCVHTYIHKFACLDIHIYIWYIYTHI